MSPIGCIYTAHQPRYLFDTTFSRRPTSRTPHEPDNSSLFQCRSISILLTPVSRGVHCNHGTRMSAWYAALTIGA